MTTELRVLRPSEWNEWFRSLELAFGGVVTDSPEERELWETLTEHERSIGIWDGPDVVGTAGAFSFRLAVPGGALVPAAGVTMVGVAATHRRRGLLTSMMRRQLDDVRALGEPLAVLTASEPAIYGRFGYGAATRQMSLEIDTDRVRLAVPDGTDEVRLRYAKPDEATAACEGVYEQLVAGRPGTPAHGPGWERRALIDPASARQGRRRCSACWRSVRARSSGTRRSASSRPGTRRAPRAGSPWTTCRRWTRRRTRRCGGSSSRST